jgi:uncharacterized protein YdcH (DUF465 family)
MPPPQDPYAAYIASLKTKAPPTPPTPADDPYATYIASLKTKAPPAPVPAPTPTAGPQAVATPSAPTAPPAPLAGAQPGAASSLGQLYGVEAIDRARPPMVRQGLQLMPAPAQRPADQSKMTSSAFVNPQKAVPQNAAEELQQRTRAALGTQDAFKPTPAPAVPLEPAQGGPQLVPSAPVIGRGHEQAELSAAPEQGKLEQAREWLANSQAGHTLQDMAPGVSSGLHLEPTESEAARIAREEHIDLPYHPIEGLKNLDAGMRVLTDQDYGDAYAKVSAMYPELEADGVVRVLAGKGIRPRSFDEREGGAHQAVSGAMETFGKPAMAAGAAINAPVTASVLVFGTIGSLVASKAAQTIGASANTVALAGDVGAILGGGLGAKGKGYTGAYGERGVRVGVGPVEARAGYRPAYRAPGPEGSYSPEEGSVVVPGRPTASLTVGGRRAGGGEAPVAPVPAPVRLVAGELAAPAGVPRETVEQPSAVSGQPEAERPVVQGSAEPAEIRASATEQEPKLQGMAEQAVAGVPGAQVEGSRVKDAESQANKAARGKPSETNIDHLGARVSAETPEALAAVRQNVEQQLPVESRDKITSNGLQADQYGVRTGAAGEANQVSELQVVPKGQADAMKETDPLYEKQKEALARGDQAEADRLGKQIEEIHKKAQPSAVSGQQPENQGRAVLQDSAEQTMLGNPRPQAQPPANLTPDVQPVREPEKLPVRPAVGGHDGRPTEVLTPTRKLPGIYRLVEASDLAPSHHAQSFEPNPEYPAGVQERDYKRSKEAQNRVIDQAQNYDPAYTVNTNPDAVNGPPVITPDGTVLGGNSRAMSTQRVYAEGRGGTYRDALRRDAAAYGLTPEQVVGMKYPVLVRQIDRPASLDEAQRIGSELNKNMTGALGVSERAVSAGKKLKPETLQTVSAMQNEDDSSLREVLGRKGPEILQMMVQDGALTERERPQYLESDGKSLSEEGKTFIERAMMGSVFNDSRLLDAAPKSIKDKIEKSLGSISAIGSRPDEWNLIYAVRPALLRAVAEHTTIARNGSTVELTVNQRSIFGPGRNPVVDALVKVLDEKPNAVRTRFQNFATDAKQNLPGATRMFGGGEAFDAFNHAFGSTLTDEEFHHGIADLNQSDTLAAAGQPQQAAGAGRGAVGAGASRGNAGEVRASAGPVQPAGAPRPTAPTTAGSGSAPAAEVEWRPPNGQTNKIALPVEVRNKVDGSWVSGTARHYSRPTNGIPGLVRVDLADGSTLRDIPAKYVRWPEKQAAGGDAGSTVPPIGAPIDGDIAKLVRERIDKGLPVKIFTRRISREPVEANRRAVDAAIREQFGVSLPITDVKDAGDGAIYDDSSNVEHNTGRILSHTTNPGDEGKPILVDLDGTLRKAEPSGATSPAMPPGGEAVARSQDVAYTDAGRTGSVSAAGGVRNAGEAGNRVPSPRSAGESEVLRIARFTKAKDAAKGRGLHENAVAARPEAVDAAGRRAVALDADSAVLWHRAFAKMTDSAGRNPLGAGQDWLGMTLPEHVSRTGAAIMREAAAAARKDGRNTAADGYDRMAKALAAAKGEDGLTTVLRGDYRDDTAREEAWHGWAIRHELMNSDAMREIATRPEVAEMAARLRKLGYGAGDPAAAQWEMAHELLAKPLAGDPALDATEAERVDVAHAFLTAAVDEFGPEILDDMPPVERSMQRIIDELKGADYGREYDQRIPGGAEPEARERVRPDSGKAFAGDAAAETGRVSREPGAGTRPTAKGDERGAARAGAKEGELKSSRPPSAVSDQQVPAARSGFFQRMRARRAGFVPLQGEAVALPGFEGAVREREAVTALDAELADLHTQHDKAARAYSAAPEGTAQFARANDELDRLDADIERLEEHIRLRHVAQARNLSETGLQLSDRLLAPRPSISGAAGRMERESPLFAGTEAGGMASLFQKQLSAISDQWSDLDKAPTWFLKSARVGETRLGDHAKLKVEQVGNGYEVQDADGSPVKFFGSNSVFRMDQAKMAAEEYKTHLAGPDMTVPYLPVTDAMRQSAMQQGFPMFQRAGEAARATAGREAGATPSKLDTSHALEDAISELAKLPKRSMTMKERVTAASDAGRDAFGTGRTKLQGALGAVHGASVGAWSSWSKPAPWTDYFKNLGDLRGAEFKSAMDVDTYQKELKRVAPSERERNAITVFSEAKDEQELKRWAAEVRHMANPAAQKRLQDFRDALRLTPEQKAVAAAHRDYFDQQLKILIDAGLLPAGASHYAMHMYASDPAMLGNIRAAASLSELAPSPGFLKERVWPNFFEALAHGEDPKTMDAGKILSAYHDSFTKAFMTRGFVKSLLTGTVEKPKVYTELPTGFEPISLKDDDGKDMWYVKGPEDTLFTNKGQTQETAIKEVLDYLNQHEKLKPIAVLESRAGWTMLDKDASGDARIVQQPKRPLDMNDYVRLPYSQLKNFEWEMTEADRKMLVPGYDKMSETEQGKLFGPEDTHFPVPADKRAAMRGDLLIHKDYAGRISDLLAESWLKTPSEHAAVNVMKAGLRGTQTAGAKVKGAILYGSGFHQVQLGTHALDHFINPFSVPDLKVLAKDQQVLEGVKHGLELLHIDPEGVLSGLPGMQSYKRYLFRDWIPRLKGKAYKIIDDRNMNRYGGVRPGHAAKMTPDEIHAMSASQTNAAFSGQDPAFFRHLDFMSGRTWKAAEHLLTFSPDFTKARAQFVAQGFSKYGGEQRLALIRGAVLMYATCRIVNAAINHDKGMAGGYWKPEDAFAVVTPERWGSVMGGKRISLRTVYGDIAGLITDPVEWGYNRLNPVTVRPTIEFITGRDNFGRQETKSSFFKNYAKQSTPIPVQKVLNTSSEGLVDGFFTAMGLQMNNYRTPLERQAAKMRIANIPDKPQDEDKQAESRRIVQEVMKLRKAGAVGADTSSWPDEAQKELGAGKWTDSEFETIVKRAGMTALQYDVDHLGMDDALEIWKRADAGEKEEMKKIMQTKGTNSIKEVGEKRAAAADGLMARLDKAGIEY